MRELLQLPGRLISETKAARPSSDLRLTGYRVEEVRLPRNLTVEVRGQQVVADKAWRVSVQGGPFPVRALPAVVWIDDEIVGNGIENETLSQVTAITFDSSLIREGGVVSISYGEDKETRRKLPQGHPIQTRRRKLMKSYLRTLSIAVFFFLMLVWPRYWARIPARRVRWP